MNPTPSISAIKRHVASEFGVTVQDLESQRRSQIVVRPRHVAMFVARYLTRLSLPVIARGFGNRDHTSVLYAVRKIENLKATDDRLARHIDKLSDTLNREAEALNVPCGVDGNTDAAEKMPEMRQCINCRRMFPRLENYHHCTPCREKINQLARGLG